MSKGITAISIRGFKSFDSEAHIQVRPLTILAGANSSGKSSIIQPLLMMKQTLDESYDPGALKINGPNVQFTSINQFLSKLAGKKQNDRFKISVEIDGVESIDEIFIKDEKKRY